MKKEEAPEITIYHGKNIYKMGGVIYPEKYPYAARLERIKNKVTVEGPDEEICLKKALKAVTNKQAIIKTEKIK